MADMARTLSGGETPANGEDPQNPPKTQPRRISRRVVERDRNHLVEGTGTIPALIRGCWVVAICCGRRHCLISQTNRVDLACRPCPFYPAIRRLAAIHTFTPWPFDQGR